MGDTKSRPFIYPFRCYFWFLHKPVHRIHFFSSYYIFFVFIYVEVTLQLYIYIFLFLIRTLHTFLFVFIEKVVCYVLCYFHNIFFSKKEKVSRKRWNCSMAFLLYFIYSFTYIMYIVFSNIPSVYTLLFLFVCCFFAFVYLLS